MPVMEAVQTFAGIANENEFYSHHYLSEVLQGDLKERLAQWADGGSGPSRAAHPRQAARQLGQSVVCVAQYQRA